MTDVPESTPSVRKLKLTNAERWADFFAKHHSDGQDVAAGRSEVIEERNRYGFVIARRVVRKDQHQDD
ncbi:MAG: hypothetical protein JF603_03970 [Acidobacteria bacterium]|nr:hypothetical protein [Acidobacteriota bacterium]